MVLTLEHFQVWYSIEYSHSWSDLVVVNSRMELFSDIVENHLF